ncbi:Mlp family lipoprotein (plasmid) [Borrelia coriaceae]|uniref:Mlp lipoprotein family protein n=1 Tax=Borrelia coriaceae ATCC 43381 TaxID=1408429 RepID=W5SVX8_9SPIR|nr:Mlp family lipoprotein [Borrelia coriaceae]AHH11344.1 Mlp lipoprotein family protein [Borrelia coriaceae ATCC 43381]UPA17347.1 Mlp family lipoprotein [Borrelia coriaceae]
MNIFIKLLVLYHTLLLYCCSEYQLNTGSNPDNTQSIEPPTLKIQEHRNENTQESNILTLTNEEKDKFNLLMFAFNKAFQELRNMIEAYQNGTLNHPRDLIEDYQHELNRYTSFVNWLSKDISKQKELANAFSPIYNLLEKERKLYANNITLEKHISNILTKGRHHYLEEYRNPVDNPVRSFFYHYVTFIRNTNEEMFEAFKEYIQSNTMIVQSLRDTVEFIPIPTQ